MSTLDKVIQRIMLLILVFLLVTRSEGASQILGSLFGGTGGLIRNLQGVTDTGSLVR